MRRNATHKSNLSVNKSPTGMPPGHTTLLSGYRRYGSLLSRIGGAQECTHKGWYYYQAGHTMTATPRFHLKSDRDWSQDECR